MSRYFVVAAALALAACGGQSSDVPAADSAATVAPAPVTTDTTVRPDTTVARDTAKADTSKAP